MTVPYSSAPCRAGNSGLGIDEHVLERIRVLAQTERRSVNGEVLALIDGSLLVTGNERRFARIDGLRLERWT